MATNFPDGSPTPYDTFQEPTAPESTSLSSGNGRTHTEHHRDLGDAIESLQRNVPLLGHDHSGGAGAFATPKLSQGNTHENHDADDGLSAIHHTLGTGSYQAAPGDHLHDYDTLPNRPFIRCTSQTRPSNPTPGLWIWEVDTNRARVWTQFVQNNIANAGLYATDDFERVNATGMGSDWAQVYEFSDRGKMAIPDGHNLSWVDTGNDPNRCVAKRSKSADKLTLTDDQIITWQTAGQAIEAHVPFVTTTGSNDMYFRMSEDGDSYLRLVFTYDEWGQGAATLWATRTGVSGEKRIGALAADVTQKWQYWTAELIGYTLTLWCGATFVGKIVDTAKVSNKGSDYRGWGVGMTAGNRAGLDALLWGQVTPSSIASVTIRDASYYTGTPIWQLLPIGAMPSVRLRQSVNQKLESTGSSILWTNALEDNFGFWNAAGDRTQVIMKEAGLYQVEAAIQWNPQTVPDVAKAAICLNGAQTTLQQQQFMRGNLFSPGFSQTLYVSGKLRCAQNDALSVKASYTASSNILDQIFSHFDDASQINSRLDLSYLGP